MSSKPIHEGGCGGTMLHSYVSFRTSLYWMGQKDSKSGTMFPLVRHFC